MQSESRRLSFAIDAEDAEAYAEGERVPVSERVRSILVCRANRRIGNILLLTPFLRALTQRFPDARIDVLIGHSGLAPLVEKLPGVGCVETLALSALWQPVRSLALWRRLRSGYDIVVDPIPGSRVNRFSVLIAKARHRLGFVSEYRRPALTHRIALPAMTMHEGLRPLHLLRPIRDPRDLADVRPDIGLSPSDLAAGKAALDEQVPNPSNEPLVGLFLDGRGAKRLSLTLWETLVERCARAPRPVKFVQLVSPTGGDRLPGVPGIRANDLRLLGAMLSHLRAFVSVDSGPMHLACAAGLPTLGLFCASSAERYYPLGLGNVALRLEGLEPNQAAEQVHAFLERTLAGAHRAPVGARAPLLA